MMTMMFYANKSFKSNHQTTTNTSNNNSSSNSGQQQQQFCHNNKGDSSNKKLLIQTFAGDNPEGEEDEQQLLLKQSQRWRRNHNKNIELTPAAAAASICLKHNTDSSCSSSSNISITYNNKQQPVCNSTHFDGCCKCSCCCHRTSKSDPIKDTDHKVLAQDEVANNDGKAQCFKTTTAAAATATTINSGKSSNIEQETQTAIASQEQQRTKCLDFSNTNPGSGSINTIIFRNTTNSRSILGNCKEGRVPTTRTTNDNINLAPNLRNLSTQQHSHPVPAATSTTPSSVQLYEYHQELQPQQQQQQHHHHHRHHHHHHQQQHHHHQHHQQEHHHSERHPRRKHTKSRLTIASAATATSTLHNNIIRHFGLQLCCLLLLRLTMVATGLAVGVDTANANLTDLGSPAPKYQTAYACEGKKLTIECEPGDLINLIRANYGRFSITICNDHGNMEWSVNCMFPKSLTVLNSRCAHKQSCGVLATTSMFGDPCPGTHKYLEAHYQCISASQTSTTTNRPSPPPWVLSNAPPILPNGSSSIINPAIVAPPLQPAQPPAPRMPPMPGLPVSTASSSPGPPTMHTTLPGGRLKANSSLKTPTRHDGLPPPPPLHHHHHTNGNHHGGVTNDQQKDGLPRDHVHKTGQDMKTSKAPAIGTSNTTTPPNTRILTGVGGSGSDDGTLLTTKTTTRQQLPSPLPSGTTTVSTLGSINSTIGTGVLKSINNINMNTGLVGEDETNLFCGPTNARNLFWNITRVGDVNVQPCPGGATGIAKWRCVLMKRMTLDEDEDISSSTQTPLCNGTSCMNLRLRNFEPTWHPLTPDLTQCRSLWLNNLEVRVNQRDSSLISIANDLSEVTSSKTLYGGDMLVTTKIIQTMSEKMFHDKETFPDQRLREAMILELLQGVVKTGSNLLDESQLSSWLDLNQEDQMRVATSLLTGLEENAFLLADTIIRERNVVQKVKNILLSVRVLETKSMQSNEVFPDNGQWQISDDRIELPKAALIENSDSGLVRIVFAAFDRLESILKPSYDHFDIKSARSYIRSTAILANDSVETSNSSPLQQRIRILNSKVISASLGKGRHIQLSQPIKLVLRHLKTENVTNPTCVFWNYIDHAWSANGCVLESTNRTHSICMCNHLTNFAILMDVMDDHTHSLFTMFDGNMRILIYVSISICLVFIVIALLTLKIFNGVFIKSARTSIYRSIYICLLLIEILFLIGIEQTETSKFCGFITVFLHCAILTAIAWFCFEAFQSYTTLTTDDILLEVDQSSKVNCYYLLSYGLSLTIVAISLAINPSTYTQNDYCVLMETNLLFYATFVAPVTIFLVGAFGYTFLSWIIMCRKARSTLKNKEHTRLTNVRFDIRCSFIFLLLLCSVWLSAYFYLRRSKIDDEMAQLYGYLFIGFNTVMGIYIFVFHCIQNEKIRREYRKYVRQNSWLPKCLRCSKTSISSGIVGGSACGMNSAGNTGTLTSNTNALGGPNTGTQLKKSKLPVGDANENEEIGNITASEDVIMATSDCEINEGISRRQGPPSVLSGAGGTLKSGIIPGNLILQHVPKSNDPAMQTNHVVLERNANAMGIAGASGTLRSTGGVHTPSAGHTSPTSSVSSTHLIFGQGHKQQQLAAGSMNGQQTQEAFYHQPDYYAWQQKALKGHSRDFHGTGMSPQQQTHEFFYWTQKHNQGHGKKKRGSNTGSDSPSGSSLHSRNTATSQQILFYPSYKKTMKQQQPPPSLQQQHPYYAEAIDPGAPPYYQRQQQQQRRPPHPQQQHQLSSDDEQMEHAAHAHLLQQMNRRVPGPGEFALTPVTMGSQQRYYRNKHSNCDLNQPDNFDLHRVGGGVGGNASETYYNQGSLVGDNGPVYEEILSNRTSDVQHYNVDDMLPQHDYEDERVMQAVYQRQQQQKKVLNRYPPHKGGRVAVGGHDYMDDFEAHAAESPYSDDDDEDEDDDRDDDEGSDDHLPAQSDERMRRLMAMQDADFQRRFQRQLRKNAQSNEGTAPPPGYHEYHEAVQPYSQSQPQQQPPQHQQPITVFGVSSGAGGSIRSFKKTASASGSRLAVNELFNHGPPLPPANQHPMPKNKLMQQLQQPPQQHHPATQPQQISPQSLNTPVVGRNISAMLDENNTVRCYLEPLEK